MLLLNQIETFYPTNQRGFKHNMLVEYLQHELLDSIFKQAGSQHLAFMGGTAIRIVYGGNRFSQDLDFDNFALTFEEFGALLEKAGQDLQYKGFEVEWRLVEKGAFHCYIKFPGLLIENNLTTDPHAKILVRVDSVRKEMIAQPAAKIINNFDVYQTILVNSPELILVQKIAAILSREKGRDIYDLSFLLGKTKVDLALTTKLLGIDDLGVLKETLIMRIDSLDLSRLALDVKPFLIDAGQINRVLGIRDYLVEVL
jgi:predicted nucleotidyltransferase component of viral defense system